MPLLLHTFGEVPAKTIKAVASFCATAQLVADVRHRVFVRLIETDKIFHNGANLGLLYYDSQTAEIWLAGIADGGTPVVLNALAHEIRHYQCWRDRELQWPDEVEPDADAKAEEIIKAVNKARRSR